LPQALSFAALFGIVSLAAPALSRAQVLSETLPETPFSASLHAPDYGMPDAGLLLAQAQPALEAAPVTAPGAVGDTSGAPAKAIAPASATGSARTRDRGYGTPEELERKRDRFAGMQKTGFGLMMGGIAAGGGGLILMITSLSSLETRRDSYGNTHTSEPGAGFFIGYISFAAAFPTLLATGITLNRIGNHKRQTYERLLEEAGHTRLDIGPDSFRFSYSF
jgi:hypothetical protein